MDKENIKVGILEILAICVPIILLIAGLMFVFSNESPEKQKEIVEEAAPVAEAAAKAALDSV